MSSSSSSPQNDPLCRELESTRQRLAALEEELAWHTCNEDRLRALLEFAAQGVVVVDEAAAS